MTVQELYDQTLKAGLNPRKVELFVAEGIPFEGGVFEGGEVAEVAFEDHPEQTRGWRGAYLVEEESIHL